MNDTATTQTGVKVDLKGVDGNVFAIMGTVTKAMRRAGVSAEAIAAYIKEATEGDYDHALQATMQYVDVQWGADEEDEDEEEYDGYHRGDRCCDDDEEDWEE